MNQVLGYEFEIVNWCGKYTLHFDDHTSNFRRHVNACVNIADKLNVYRESNRIYWNILLLNFGFLERHLTYQGYFPIFNSKHNLESFIILLNSHLLINILPE